MGLGKTIKKAYMKGKKKAYGSKGVKGRYVRPGFTKGVTNLMKDIEMIKSRLNVEKKHQESDVTTSAIGQCNGNSDGVLALDITPQISQGTGDTNRVGNSLKMTGISLPMSFTQQVKCRGDRRVRITLLKVRSADDGVSNDEALASVWDINPLTGQRDFNCPRAYRNSKNDGIAVVRSKVVYIKAPQVPDNTSSIDTERIVVNCRFNVKLDDIFRYSQNSDVLPNGVRYYLVFQCNAGNLNGAVDSTLDVPVTEAGTGLVLRLGQRNWWVDN